MKQKLRKVLTLCLALIFIFSMGMFLYYTVQSNKGADIYSEAEDLANAKDGAANDDANAAADTEDEWQEAPVTDDSYFEKFKNKNLDALRMVNADVFGWITIPDTKISYPILQGEDNQYYLKHTWNEESNFVGSIFLECMNSSDFSDFNTIIYGHNMFDDTMFGVLNNYKEEEFWKAHPYIYTYDDRGCHRYEIFAIYEADIESDTYRLGFKTDEIKQQFIDECLEQSVVDTGVTPTPNDRILTLSTCTNRGYSTRWVVQARLKGLEK